MNEKEQVMYNEVYYILHMLGEKYINKIPKKLYTFIESNTDLKEIDYIDKSKNIADQIQNDTITFISYLNLEYWCDENEKERLLKVYKNNDILEEKMKREKYNVDNIFNNNIKSIDKKEDVKDLVKNKEPNWLERICSKFVKWVTDTFKKEK